MATFLQLLEKAAKESPLQGTPSSVNDPGLFSTLAGLISSTWEDFQSQRKDLFFRRKSTTFMTNPGQKNYTESDITAGAFTIEEIVKALYNDVPLEEISLEEIDKKPAGPPKYFTNEHDLSILLSINEPDNTYEIKLYYNEGVQTLAEDSDEVLLKTMGQNYLIYEALYRFATSILQDKGLAVSYKERAKAARAQLLRQSNPAKRLVPKRVVV